MIRLCSAESLGFEVNRQWIVLTTQYEGGSWQYCFSEESHISCWCTNTHRRNKHQSTNLETTKHLNNLTSKKTFLKKYAIIFVTSYLISLRIFFNAILRSSTSSAERWALQAEIISGFIKPKHANTLIRICIHLVDWAGDSCPILNILPNCVDFRSCLLNASHTILIAQIIARLANQAMILLSCCVNEARSIFRNESPRINPNVARKKWISYN